MYTFQRNKDHMLVKFENDFDRAELTSLIQLATADREYPATNDIWLVGPHHAVMSMGDLIGIMDSFCNCCPQNCSQRRTAFVANHGMTEGLLGLMAKDMGKRLPFECRLFHNLAEAQNWLKGNRTAA